MIKLRNNGYVMADETLFEDVEKCKCRILPKWLCMKWLHGASVKALNCCEEEKKEGDIGYDKEQDH